MKDYISMLEEIAKDKGIDFIENYIKECKKKDKSQTRDKDNLRVALNFYELRNNGLKTKSATETLKDDLGFTDVKRVTNHITAFNKKAEKINYINFGSMIKEFYDKLVQDTYIDFDNLKMIIESEARKYYIPKELALASYYKFLVDINDPKKMDLMRVFIRDYSQYKTIEYKEYKSIFEYKDEMPF